MLNTHNDHIEHPRFFVKSLARGFQLMKVIAQAGRPVTLTEIANKLGDNCVTTSRICYTLTKLGYIQRTHGKAYQLTPQVLELGFSAIFTTEWREIANYFLNQLFQELNETVNAVILVDASIFYIIRIPKLKIINLDIKVGTRFPVHCTSMGKVLMAYSSQEKINEALQRIEFERFNENTITNLNQYMKELNKVRKRGYAISDEEHTIGYRSISVPLIDKTGYAFAAINVNVRSVDYTVRDMEIKILPKLQRCAKQIIGRQ
jgi:IclR family pca regulon transcriptional regulator